MFTISLSGGFTIDLGRKRDEEPDGPDEDPEAAGPIGFQPNPQE